MIYSVYEYVCFFFVYSFLGWIYEEIYSIFKYGKIINRGFLNGPMALKHGFLMLTVIILTRDLSEYPLYQYVVCLAAAFVVDVVGGSLVRWMTGKTLWDYTGVSFNLGKYSNVLSVFAWGSVAAVNLWLIHPSVVILYRWIPLNILKIGLIVASVILFIDMVATYAVVLKWRLNGNIYGKVADSLGSAKKKLGTRILGFIERRMNKAFPELAEQKNNQITGFGVADEKRVFAKGLCFYKLAWMFFLSGLVGDLIETIFVLITSGHLSSRSSVIYGTFSIVWALGGALITGILYPMKDKNIAIIFVSGTVLGGVYEYACSVFTELVFGTIFWDYSHIPFNINGRINLLYCFFWGFAAIAWVKLVYPLMSYLVEKIPAIPGTIATWLLVILLCLDMLVSAVGIVRYVERKDGIEPGNIIEEYCDGVYTDALIDRIYPYMKLR